MSAIRHDWQTGEIEALFEKPFNDLLFRAQAIHREHFDANQVQVSTLLSIKTGACPEDCGYCSQSSKYDTGLEREKLLPLDEVIAAAKVIETVEEVADDAAKLRRLIEVRAGEQRI